MAFDEALLDDADALARRDEGRLLWSLATAGAQVRRAAETVADFGIDRLRSGDAPRALLVAVDEPGAEQVLARCSRAGTAALSWTDSALPRWAGPADALLVGTAERRSPRLASLAAQGAQRGLALAAVAPAGSDVAVAAGRAPLHELPRELNARAARWSLLAPLFQALDCLAVTAVPPSLLIEVADALDEQAELCRPSGETFTHAAKSLAVEFAESRPVIVGAGQLAAVAADVIASSLGLSAGRAANSVALPRDFGYAAALVRASDSAADADDFFRDRVDESTGERPRLVVVGDDGAADDVVLGDRSEAQLADELAARHIAQALRELAERAGVRTSSVDVPAGQPLARFASATAFGDFTAAYLALGLGLDPSAPTLGAA